MLIGSDRFAALRSPAGRAARARCLALLLASAGAPALALAGCGGSSHAAPPATAQVGDAGAAGTVTASDTTATAAGPSKSSQARTSATGTSKQSGAGAGGPHASVKSAPGGAAPSPGGPAPSPGGAHPHKPAAHGKPKAGAGVVPGGSNGASGSAPNANTGAPNANTGVPFTVETSSMEPTFQPETKVYYDPTRTRPQVGEVIVFYLPAGGEEGACGEALIGGRACDSPEPGQTKAKLISLKRVVGLPGDSIAIRDGRVIRNGQPESEPPLVPCGKDEHVNCEFPTPITVPPNDYYVMADNRGLYKEDSRIFGPVPQEYILGTVEGG